MTSERTSPMAPNWVFPWATGVVLVILLVCGPGQIRASEAMFPLAGTTFPAACGLEHGDLPVRGQGVLKYAVFLKAYAATLYGAPAGSDRTLLSEAEPKCLEIVYFVSIDAEDFGRAADAILARQQDESILNSLRQRLDRLHANYRDVRPHDRYTLVYEPNKGTTLYLNRRQLITVPGDDFAAAYFGIWLADQPISVELSRSLLGQS